MELKNIEAYTSSRRRFVLAVDNKPRVLQHLTALLKQFGYDVYASRTAAGALEFARVVSPVLAVAACKLDGENTAVGLINAMRKADPESKVPFIVLFSKSDPAAERDCLSAGALTCMHAPVSVENFYRVIQVAIEPIPRMTIRIGVNLPAQIQGKRTDESICDISENGAYLLTERAYPLSTKLSVTIGIADSEVSADAVVIYTKQKDPHHGGRSGVGLQFARISEDDQLRIRMFIRTEMAKGMVPLKPAP
ncbi:MAG: response regulator [Nitrospiraceae bacterium]|nr:response regulator [Nitrospiraceae bacterium]